MGKWYDNEDFLLHRLAAGDEKAFEFLVRQYYAGLVKVSSRIIGSQEQARDVTQDMFADLWEKRFRLHLPKPVKPYLFRAVINRSLNYLRDHPGVATVSVESIRRELYATSADDASAKLEEKELSRFMAQAIQSLPPQCKAAFQLNRDEGMSYREIADSLGISVKAVEKHISRALRKLRKSLEAYLKSLLICL